MVIFTEHVFEKVITFISLRLAVNLLKLSVKIIALCCEAKFFFTDMRYFYVQFIVDMCWKLLNLCEPY